MNNLKLKTFAATFEARYKQKTFYINVELVARTLTVTLEDAADRYHRNPCLKWLKSNHFSYVSGLNFSYDGNDTPEDNDGLEMLAISTDFRRWFKADVLPVIKNISK